jgi:EmrB/QacA subfamily drug resistance transporter
MSPSRRPDRQTTQRAALIVATLSSFLGPFMGSSVNVALPSMGRDLAMSAILMGWVNMAFLLAGAAFAIPFGRLGDIYGRKKIFVTGVATFTLASIITALAPSPAAVIGARVLQGFGAAMVLSTGMAILISVFPPEQRGRVLGINVAAVYFGLSSGPFLGGIITHHLGWRFLFWLNLPIGLLLLVVTLVMLKGDFAEDHNARFDLLGALLLGPSLLATMVGFSRLPAPLGIALLLGGLTLLAGFVIHELRTPEPIIDVRIFRHNIVFALSSLAALINYAATFAVVFLLSIYLQKVKQLSPQETGLVLVSQPFVQAVLSPVAGRLSDRIESRIVATVGMGVVLVGLILLNFVGMETSLPWILGCLVLLGVGFALFSSPNTNAIMGSVQRPMYGVASAVVSTMRQVGMTVSMGVVMIVFAAHLGQAEISAGNLPAFVTSMRIVFTVCAVLCFAGIFASLARGKARDPGC